MGCRTRSPKIMLTHQELRRYEALERIEKRKEQGEFVQLQPEKVKPGKPKNSKQVQKLCEICAKPYYVQRSHAPRRRTCGSKECNTQIRSISRRSHPLWTNPKKCELPDCPNFLEPNRNKSRQKKFCSKRCSGLRRRGDRSK